jgi:molybdopterin synthase catalytic subunit
MTNTLHRQGTIESLKDDYVIFAHTAKGITREGSGPKIREFMRICLKYHPVNIGDGMQGNILQDAIDIQKLISNQGDGAGAMAVFTDLDTLQKVIKDLMNADLGLSINISGLLDEVKECCQRAGLQRHSVEHSLGFWGAKDRLPEREILIFNTMCGHGMVSFNLIRKMIEYMKLRRLTPKKAARIMAKCCECGAFNPLRAEMLLEKVRKGEKSLK